jgi:hypothetical protein
MAGASGGGGVLCVSRANYAYTPPASEEHEHDLSFAVGDIIAVVAREVEDLGPGWAVGRLGGETGFFPSNYCAELEGQEAAPYLRALRGDAASMLEPEPEPGVASQAAVNGGGAEGGAAAARRAYGQRAAGGLAHTSSASTRGLTPTESALSRQRSGTHDLVVDGEVLGYMRANYAYEPPPEPDHEQDLRLRQGDVIRVLRQEVEELGPGWSLGMLNDGTGFFPANYCSPMTAQEVALEAARASVGKSRPGELGSREAEETRQRTSTAELHEPRDDALL